MRKPLFWVILLVILLAISLFFNGCQFFGKKTTGVSQAKYDSLYAKNLDLSLKISELRDSLNAAITALNKCRGYRSPGGVKRNTTQQPPVMTLRPSGPIVSQPSTTNQSSTATSTTGFAFNQGLYEQGYLLFCCNFGNRSNGYWPDLDNNRSTITGIIDNNQGGHNVKIFEVSDNMNRDWGMTSKGLFFIKEAILDVFNTTGEAVYVRASFTSWNFELLTETTINNTKYLVYDGSVKYNFNVKQGVRQTE